MNLRNFGSAMADRITDRAVWDLAEEKDVSLPVARATLEAEAFSDLTGAPIDYHTDWRDRCRYCGEAQSSVQNTCGSADCVSKAIKDETP